MSGKPWSSEERQLAMKMWRLGCTTREIAKRLGRTTTSVKSFMKNYRKDFPLDRGNCDAVDG